MRTDIDSPYSPLTAPLAERALVRALHKNNRDVIAGKGRIISGGVLFVFNNTSLHTGDAAYHPPGRTRAFSKGIQAVVDFVPPPMPQYLVNGEFTPRPVNWLRILPRRHNIPPHRVEFLPTYARGKKELKDKKTSDRPLVTNRELNPLDSPDL